LKKFHGATDVLSTFNIEPSSHLALEDKIDLDFFLDFFDQYFFCGVLSEWTSVTWVDFDQNQRYLVGSQRDDPVSPDPFGLIKIVKWRFLKPWAPSAIRVGMASSNESTTITIAIGDGNGDGSKSV